MLPQVIEKLRGFFNRFTVAIRSAIPSFFNHNNNNNNEDLLLHTNDNMEDKQNNTDNKRSRNIKIGLLLGGGFLAAGALTGSLYGIPSFNTTAVANPINSQLNFCINLRTPVNNNATLFDNPNVNATQACLQQQIQLITGSMNHPFSGSMLQLFKDNTLHIDVLKNISRQLMLMLQENSTIIDDQLKNINNKFLHTLETIDKRCDVLSSKVNNLRVDNI